MQGGNMWQPQHRKCIGNMQTDNHGLVQDLWSSHVESVFWDAYIPTGLHVGSSERRTPQYHFSQRKRPQQKIGYPPCLDKNQSLSSFFRFWRNHVILTPEIRRFPMFGGFRSSFCPSFVKSLLGTSWWHLFRIQCGGRAERAHMLPVVNLRWERETKWQSLWQFPLCELSKAIENHDFKGENWLYMTIHGHFQ